MKGSSTPQVRGHLRPGSLRSSGPGEVAHGAGHRLRVAEPRLGSSEMVGDGGPLDAAALLKKNILATLVTEGGSRSLWRVGIVHSYCHSLLYVYVCGLKLQITIL